MSKYTIILIILGIIVVITGTLLFLFWTGLIFILNGIMTGSYCASVGVERLTDREIGIRQNYNDSEPIEFLDFTDEDLKKIPALKKAIDKVGNRVEFNKQGYTTLSYGATIYYYDYLNMLSQRQHNAKLNEWWFLIEHNGKTYGVSNLMIPESPQEVQISVEQTTHGYNAVKLTDDDLQNYVPQIKDAINEIGTYEMSPYDGVGLPEDEWNYIQNYFEEKYQKQYNKNGTSWYFHYNNKNYSAGFAIC
ncbi:MAG: hypothetical protein ACT4NT_02345 [Nitrososphaerota archaeon]